MQNYKRFLQDLQIGLTIKNSTQNSQVSISPAITSQLDLILCSHAPSTCLDLPTFTASLTDIASFLFQA